MTDTGKAYKELFLVSCMSNRNKDASLIELRGSLTRLKALNAWRDLKEQERRPGERPVLSASSDLSTELRNEQGYFWKTATRILDTLNVEELARISESKLQERRQEVLRMKSEMENLDLPKTL